MNKQEVVKELAKRLNKNQSEVQDVLQGLQALVIEKLQNNEKVQLTGFVTFEPVAREARKGFDPVNKVPLEIPRSVGAAARAGKKLKAAVTDLRYEDVVKATKTTEADAE